MDIAHSKRIGILGGTFNPLHSGHLILAQDALEASELDQVWFLPCAQPAHKPGHIVAPAEHRINMLRAGIQADPRLHLSLVEIERAGTSYTIDTLRHLTTVHPSIDWHFIIGTDTLLELHSWKDIHELLPLCKMISMRRPGIPAAEELRGQIQLPPPWPDRLVDGLFAGHLIDISSTEVRNRVALGQSIRYLVPLGVEEYILAHGLYNSANTIGEESSNRSN